MKVIEKDKKIPHEITIKPIFQQQLSPAKFQKGWFYSLTGFGQWTSCDDNVNSIGDINEGTLTNKTKFKLLSYNVWGAPQDSQSPYFQFELRAKAILDILEQESPDIICLQEVSKDWALKILNNDYIRTHYFSTDAAPDRMERYFGLSQITLSKYPIVACTVYGLPGYEIYSLLNTKVKINDKIVSINNIHLHSGKEHTAFRIAQLETIFSILEEDNCPVKIIAGDFNFGDGTDWPENSYLYESYCDIWNMLHPKNPGFTENTYINNMRYQFKKSHKQERFDRVLLNSDNTICYAYKMKCLGQTPITDGDDIWPSDHFGLATKFVLK